jgi:hypothetical protein
MRYFFIVLIGIGLSGCAIPIPLQIASWAASGISYITTGKSMSDHAVSAVASQDCAVHRLVLGRSMCEAFVDESEGTAVAQVNAAAKDTATPDSPTQRLRDSMISLAEKLDGDLQPAAGPADSETGLTAPLRTKDDKSSSALGTVDNALVALAETINSTQQDETPKIRVETANAQHYLIIGQFRQLREAEAVRTRHASLQTVVRMVLDEGALLFQVTAGPFSRPDAVGIGATIATGDTRPEIALLCADRATRAPCGNHPDPATAQLSLRPVAGK